MLIDISKQANRRPSDKTENDGRGGWTDQGPSPANDGQPRPRISSSNSFLCRLRQRCFALARNAVQVLRPTPPPLAFAPPGN